MWEATEWGEEFEDDMKSGNLHWDVSEVEGERKVREGVGDMEERRGIRKIKILLGREGSNPLDLARPAEQWSHS